MSKQERKAKAAKAADAVVAAGVESAVAAVQGKADLGHSMAATDMLPASLTTKVKRGALPAEHAALAAEVKGLRESGLAWWQIGHKLALPGSADNVAQGKGGAAYARKIWKAAFGEVPRVQTRTGKRSKRAEKNDHVRELKATTKTERVEAVRRGVSVIKPEMTDEQVIEMLTGRVITWSFNLGNVDGQEDDFYDCTIGVFPKTCKVLDIKGDRAIEFRELDPSAPISVRGVPGAMRVVRVSAIHTVK